jgi:transcription elongation factor S-II
MSRRCLILLKSSCLKQEDDSGVENKSQGSEVLLEETIKQLREENGSYLQKEVIFSSQTYFLS